tara:strand:+ start:269 stop:883 length:615 start_codon:yes stop_codon:yes gene_type:complete
MNPRVGIIDYECGNIGSLVKAFSFIECDVQIIQDGKINNCSHLVLPGVGSFSQGSKYIFKSKNLLNVITSHFKEGKPLLGICLGYQLFSKKGIEGGLSKGFGFVDADCKHLSEIMDTRTIKIPNVGFHRVSSDTSTLNLKNNCYYFVHSYALEFKKVPQSVQKIALGKKEINIGFQLNNLWGFQFHPEKSQILGLNLLKEFISI